jgi:outer membrane biosynthesis protein TonB
LDEWRKSLKIEVTRIVELLKPIVDKYSFLVPRTFLVVQLIELSETELDELFVKKHESKKPESKKPESKKPESEKPESKKPESEKPESEKPESKKPESKKPKSKEPESKKPESKKPGSKEEPKPKEGGRKVEDTPQINYVKGIPSEKRQKKLEEREMKLMEEAENAEKSRLKIEQAAKEQAAKELEAKQQASKQVAVKNYIFAEIDPINNKIKTYSDEIKKILASANYTDTTFDTLMKIDVEQLYSTIQSNFGAFAELFDREDGKFKYMFNYEPDLEQLLIKQEYRKAQCMLLFTIGYLNDILSKSGIDYAKYILKGGGAMKLRLAEILAGKQTDLLFFSNDIDVKSYLNLTKFAKVVDPNFLRIYQFGLSLIISKIFRELTIRDLMMLKFFPERSILKIQINFLEPDTQPLASKIMSRGSATAVFKISLQFAGENIPIADIDPSPPSEIGIPTTQDLIVDNFKSQELKFYVDNFSEFVDDKIKYYQVYYDAYLQNPQDDYISKTFRKFLKYINLFIKLMQIEETLFNKEQKENLKQIEEQKDLEKIEEKLKKQMEEKLKKQMEEKLKRKSSNPYLVQPPQPPELNQGGK